MITLFTDKQDALDALTSHQMMEGVIGEVLPATTHCPPAEPIIGWMVRCTERDDVAAQIRSYWL